MKRITIFEWLDVFGSEVAPVYDWRNHLREYDYFNKSPREFLVVSSYAGKNLSVHSRDNLHISLELYPKADGNTFEGFNPYSEELENVVSSDLGAMRLKMAEFARWLSKLLCSTIKGDVREVCGLWQLFSEPLPVFLVHGMTAKSAQPFLRQLAGGPCILLFCSRSRMESSSWGAELARFSSFHPFAVLDFIKPVGSKGKYERLENRDFEKEMRLYAEPVLCSSLFARKHDAGFDQLYMVIDSQCKTPAGAIEEEESITVYYKSNKNQQQRECETKDIKVSQIKAFCRTEKGVKVRSSQYALLRRFAASFADGEIVWDDDTSITRLRRDLRSILGFSKQDNPILSVPKRTNVFKIAFNVMFKDRDAQGLVGNVPLDTTRDFAPAPARKARQKGRY